MRNKMLIVALATGLITAAAVPAFAAHNGNSRDTNVPICHKGRTIHVSPSAVPAHIRHGDTAGACTTATPTVAATDTPEATPTETPEATPTETPEAEPTATETPEATATPTEEPTATPTEEGPTGLGLDSEQRPGRGGGRGRGR